MESCNATTSEAPSALSVDNRTEGMPVERTGSCTFSGKFPQSPNEIHQNWLKSMDKHEAKANSDVQKGGQF